MWIETFADTAAAPVRAISMSYAEAGIGIARAAKVVHSPIVNSFTVESNGSPSTGELVAEIMRRVDEFTSGDPAYLVLHCAHASHFDRVVGDDDPWPAQIRGRRADASRISHVELSEASEFDAGNPPELAHVGLPGGGTSLPLGEQPLHTSRPLQRDVTGSELRLRS